MQKLHKILLWAIAFVAIASTAVPATRLQICTNNSSDTSIALAIKNRTDIPAESIASSLYKNVLFNNWVSSELNTHQRKDDKSGYLLNNKPGIRFTRWIARNLTNKFANARILSFQTTPYKSDASLLYIITIADISISNNNSHIPLNKGPTFNI